MFWRREIAIKPERSSAPAKEKRPSINLEIKAREVRLIDKEGQQAGIMPLRDALAAAEAVQLDLVEIVADAEPPVCRIMDYGKFVFEQK